MRGLRVVSDRGQGFNPEVPVVETMGIAAGLNLAAPSSACAC